MKKIMNIAVVTLLLIVVTMGNTIAQQWSSEQKEVWAGVNKYWSANNTQELMQYFDESYMGWDNSSRVPQNKANTAKSFENSFKNSTPVLYTLSPLTIWVKGDFAYVHYYYTQINKSNKTGKDKTSSGIWTDILMKKGGKWVLIGDHGGRTSK